MPPTKGLKFTRDGGLIIHPNALDSVGKDSVKIPATDTAEGAGFGDTLTDKDVEFASEREPVAHFLVYGMAADITDKWFAINDPDTEEADPALDRTVQAALTQLKFKQKLTQAIELERRDGWCLIVGGFTDAQNVDGLKLLLTAKAELRQLAVYAKTKIHVETKDENSNSERFGEPLIYKIDRGGGQFLFVHWTRTFKLQTRSNGKSVLEPVWDDLTCGRNIRWGAAQWMYRNGAGFPVIEFPAGTTVDKLEEYANSGAFANLMSRTYICTAQNSAQENTGMKFHFEGAAGHALDPVPFFKTNVEQISIATGIPQPKLVGAQAGAVTGSEVNMQDYYKIVSRIQALLDDCVRWVIDKLAASGQLSLVQATGDQKLRDKLRATLARVFSGDYRHKTAKTYVVDWNSAFELSELDEAEVELKKTQANQAKLDYMTIDEVRAQCEEQLDALPNGEGAKLKSAGFGLFGEGGEEKSPIEGNDKFLVVDLKRKRKHEHVSSSGSGSSSSS